jgi:type IV fimbrial biogenesis protein FimT
MVVIAIIAILAGIAVPSFRDLIERQQVVVVADELQSALELAKTSAIQKNGNVMISKLTDTEAGTSGVCSNANEWSCGWRVFFDANADGVFTTPGDTLMLEFLVTSGVSVNMSVIVDNNPVASTSLVANRWGQLAGNSQFHLFTTRVGNASPAANRVCISTTGRTRVVRNGATCP